MPLDCLDPYKLAEHLGIKILRPTEIKGVSQKSLTQLLKTDPDGWSAITLRMPSTSIIILNTAHSHARQASDLMHELSHILLAHTPARVDVTDELILLLRTHDRSQEEEAQWLAGCLLLPRPVVLSIHRKGTNSRDAANEYGVSMDMLKYRLQVTGVAEQARRARARFAR